MRKLRGLLILTLGISVFGACASSGTSSRSRSGPDLLTEDDIGSGQYSTAHDVVQRLRPQWLRARSGATPFGDDYEIKVYVDGVPFGNLASLSGISAPTIARMEWVNATTATQRWGTGHAAGVISIATRQ